MTRKYVDHYVLGLPSSMTGQAEIGLYSYKLILLKYLNSKIIFLNASGLLLVYASKVGKTSSDKVTLIISRLL